ncbi:MAG: FAD/NAD(P)-binding oxidoreductase, partial [Steroidobacteraceae bacterium]
ARVAAERGHEVLVFEAAAEPGGQIRLTARSSRRREMMSIIDWRMAQCAARGVRFRFESPADAEDVITEAPEVVIVATGGLPRVEVLESGNDLVVSSWDIISGRVAPRSEVLLFDDAGDHVGLQAAEILAAAGARVEMMTPERTLAPEVMNMNLVPYMRALQRLDVTFTLTYRLLRVSREGDRLLATLGSDYDTTRSERRIDQVVVNDGTIPSEELYFTLKPLSANLGEVDHDRLLAGLPQNICRNPEGTFQLFRVGDAVACRNTHAAIYDALRLVKDL